MRRRSRVLIIGALVGLLGAVGTITEPVGAQTDGAWGDADEQQFVQLINDLRTSQGLPALAVDLELTNQARLWSQTMKERGTIFHSSDLGAGISANWQKLGENVGVGGTVQALFDAFVASPTHYANLVDPDYRSLGIGVVWDGTRMFTAHRFMAVFPPKAPAPAPPAPALSSPSPSLPAPPASTAPPVLAPVPGPPAPPEAAAPAPPEAEAAAPALDPERLDAILAALADYPIG